MTGLVFTVAFLFAMVRVPSPKSGIRRGLAPGALLAVPFVSAQEVQPADLTVAFVGATLGTLALWVFQRKLLTTLAIVEGISAAAALTPFWLWSLLPGAPGEDGLLAIAAGLTWFGIDIVVRAGLREGASENLWQRLQRAAGDWHTPTLSATSGLFFGLIYSYTPAWAVAAAGIPIIFLEHLFAGVSESRRAVEIAVESLGSLPEAAGLVPAGHSRIAAETARKLATALGVPAREIDEIVIAARLHELGAVRTADPAIRDEGFSTADIGRWGADLLSVSRRLERTAARILEASEPYRLPGMPSGSHDPGADIVRVACAYEKLRRRDQSHIEAVEDLHLASSQHFNQAVVEALWAVEP
jgi:hypothetical protein